MLSPRSWEGPGPPPPLWRRELCVPHASQSPEHLHLHFPTQGSRDPWAHLHHNRTRTRGGSRGQVFAGVHMPS